MTPKTFLVVDDDTFTQAIVHDFLQDISTLLQITNPIFHQALDGHHAITFLQQTIPDLIVLDIHLPNKDGFSVIEHLGSIAYTGYLILISGTIGYTLTSAQLMAKWCNLNCRHMQKPITMNALLDTMKELMP